MGNVMAASSTPSSAAASLDKAAKSGVPAPPPAPAGYAPVDAPAAPSSPETKLENPGTVEELHKKCKGMSNVLEQERSARDMCYMGVIVVAAR